MEKLKFTFGLLSVDCADQAEWKRWDHKMQRRLYDWQRPGRGGIRKKQIVAILEEQGGECGVQPCHRGLSLGSRGLCLDHDHRSGKLRGILCDPHNKIVRSVRVAKGVLEYLEKTRN
jgi:Recombination endonuclease VII